MDTRTKIFLTGFEPFGQLSENPSQVVAKELSSMEWDNAEIRCQILPVEFIAATEKIAEFYRGDWLPNVILHLGVAKSRNTITLERFAVNLMDTKNGDNNGFWPDEVPITTNAPLAYQSTIPCKRIIEHLKNKGFDAKLSNSAGTYVCNAVLFTSLHIISTASSDSLSRLTRDTQCGFIHLPLFENIDKDLQLKTLKTIIQWLVKNQQQAFLECLSHGNVL